jgi:hypothetical protein
MKFELAKDVTQQADLKIMEDSLCAKCSVTWSDKER